MLRQHARRSMATLLLLVVAIMTSQSVNGQTYLRDICTVKGQEKNVLRGVGLVIGLNGTGDPNLQLGQSALAELLNNSGMEMQKSINGQTIAAALKDVKNVALVIVTATVDGAGGRQGSLVNCQVQSIGNATSLEGGTLVPTSLTGGLARGEAGDLPLLATAWGRVYVDPIGVPTTATIHDGCQLENDQVFRNSFTQVDEKGDLYVDLVIGRTHTAFTVAAEIADAINSHPQIKILSTDGENFATALDQTTVRVRIPKHDGNEFGGQASMHVDPVAFVGNLLDEVQIVMTLQSRTVVINETTGTIVVGEDVRFSPVAVTSGDFSIEKTVFYPVSLEVSKEELGRGEDGQEPQRLLVLINALNQLKAPAPVQIDILKRMHDGGYLFGKFVVITE